MECGEINSGEQSGLLAALGRSDASAWCFFSLLPKSAIPCSSAFLHLWNIPQKPPLESTGCYCSLTDFTRALLGQGIYTDEFLALVAKNSIADSPPILLVCGGVHKVQANVESVKFAGRVVGHLVRFHRPAATGDALHNMVLQVSAAQRKLDVLSARERQILQMVFDGRTNKSISIGVEISEKTVEKHRARIMQKLGLNCTAQLFRLVSKAWLFSDILGLSALPGNADSNGNPAPKPNAPPFVCDDQ